MLKLNILNMKQFLETVNRCTGGVFVLGPDGSWVQIDHRYAFQQELQAMHTVSGGCLPLTLRLKNPADHMRIVAFYAGDC